MLPGPVSRPPSDVLLDYGDPAAPRVTHVRGILIAGSRAGLHTLGLFERYADLLPALHKDALLYCVASSWLPMDQTLAHFEACDQLGLTRSHFDAIGAALADRMTKTFLAAALRTMRSMGADGQVRWAMSHFDRFLRRIYCGGRCRVEQRGPKDLLFELNGIPFAQSQYYQGVVLSETKVLLGMLCRKMFARQVSARGSSRESLALSINWV